MNGEKRRRRGKEKNESEKGGRSVRREERRNEV